MQGTGRSYRYVDVITALFVAVLLISNIASTKLTTIWVLTFDGGTLLFPLSYVLGDVITEVYGFARARRVIWLGFIASALMAFTLFLVMVLPPASTWPFQEAFENVVGLTPRIVCASLIAFLAGSFSNAYVLAKMKVWSRGRALWARVIGSTLVGEGIDTVLFVIIAFAGVFSGGTLVVLIISNYLFKCAMEVVLVPVTYRVVRWLKRKEDIDFYDRETNFTPLRFGTHARQ